nr:hypothetical protein [Paenibacillus sp. MER TA 81-3]
MCWSNGGSCGTINIGVFPGFSGRACLDKHEFKSTLLVALPCAAIAPPACEQKGIAAVIQLHFKPPDIIDDAVRRFD